MESTHGIVNIKDWVIKATWKNGIESNSEFISKYDAEKYKEYLETEYKDDIIEIVIIEKK